MGRKWLFSIESGDHQIDSVKRLSEKCSRRTLVRRWTKLQRERRDFSDRR